uniref:Major tropism determinant N-terminal domain-containing protein n=1 Tax=viral metagenome TaxID=1070528 RepID=A0A6C0B3M5_9ZZZZ
MAEIVTLKFRRGTTNEWVQSTRPLAQGEPGFDVVSGALKIGDGMSSWQNLPGFFPSSNLVNYVAGTTPISIGYQSSSGITGTVAVGGGAGSVTQGSYAVALGRQAGFQNQGVAGVAMGIQAGYQNQGAGAVAIGVKAGYSGQGRNAIAIGTGAGTVNQADNSIILNASNVGVTGPGQSGAFYVSPVRNASSPYVMNYNPTTSEVSYSQQLDSSSGIDAYTLIKQLLSTELTATLVGSGTTTFDISELLPVIRTFPTSVTDILGEFTGNAFQFNAYWGVNSSYGSVMTSGYLRFSLRSITAGDTSTDSSSNKIIYDIAELNKKAIAFDDKLVNTYEIKFQYLIAETEDTILQLVMDWVDIDVSTEIRIDGVVLVPFAYQQIIPPGFTFNKS